MTDTPIIVHGHAQQIIELPIRASPPNGYDWKLALPKGVDRASDGPGQPTQRLGDPAGGALRVVATTGRHRITATLGRAWQDDAPLRTVVIDLLVD